MNVKRGLNVQFIIYNLTLIFFLLFSSCKNEVDIVADYKDITVVYGLLNQADSIQYIKVNRAFLGKGNASEMAQVSDSSTYNNLEVKLERWKNNVLAETYLLEKTISVSKESGTFSYPNQVLYKTNSNGKKLDGESEYHLRIRNTQTGKEETFSNTKLISNLSITNPLADTMNKINFTNINHNFPYKVTWNSAVNGILYQVSIRFHYIEEDKLGGNITSKYVDWVLGTEESRDLSGGQPMSISFSGSRFYQFIKIMIPANDDVYRHPGKLDFIFSVASDDFNTYMQVTKPSTGIVQEKTSFTNITNGIGLFSSRLTMNILNKSLTSASLDSLYNGQYTRNLFCSPEPLSHFYCR